MLTIYSILYTLGFFATLPMFLWKREKYLHGFSQRLGKIPEFSKDSAPVIWVHCVSVGEVNAARPLIAALRKAHPEHRLVVSTVTKTGQDLAVDVFRDQAELVFYFPFDWKFAVRRALRAIRPDIVLVLETEIWFNFFRETHRRGIILAIVNGRLSEKSMRGYRRIKGTIRRVLRYVDYVMAQSERDAARYHELGVRRKKIVITGNIKNDQMPGEEDKPRLAYFRERFSITGEAPVIVAASTHSTEEKTILEAFSRLKSRKGFGAARLIIAPRHPERFQEVWGLIDASEFEAARRTDGLSLTDGDAEVVLIDSIGELRSVYPLANLVFIGGSLITHGGQNILEPALEQKAILTGPHMENFAAAVDQLKQEDAIVVLPDAEEGEFVGLLADEFHRLLADGGLREKLGANAYKAATANRGATERTLQVLEPVLRIQAASLHSSGYHSE